MTILDELKALTDTIEQLQAKMTAEFGDGLYGHDDHDGPLAQLEVAKEWVADATDSTEQVDQIHRILNRGHFTRQDLETVVDRQSLVEAGYTISALTEGDMLNRIDSNFR